MPVEQHRGGQDRERETQRHHHSQLSRGFAQAEDSDEASSWADEYEPQGEEDSPRRTYAGGDDHDDGARREDDDSWPQTLGGHCSAPAGIDRFVRRGWNRSARTDAIFAAVARTR